MITNTHSGTHIDEIAPQTYRISTPIDIPGIPGGFTFGQFLIVDDEPVLFHTGMRRTFPLVAEAISKVMPIERLRHIGYSHYEADESGALAEFLAAAPNAAAMASEIGVLTNLNDALDRPSRALADGEELKIGSRTLQWIYTPHVPHGWDCGVLFDKTHGTLFSGDLFTQAGSKHPAVTETEILTASEMMRKPMEYFAHGRNQAQVLERLAALNPKLLACMHGATYRGDGAQLLRGLSAALAADSLAQAA